MRTVESAPRHLSPRRSVPWRTRQTGQAPEVGRRVEVGDQGLQRMSGVVGRAGMRRSMASNNGLRSVPQTFGSVLATPWRASV